MTLVSNAIILKASAGSGKTFTLAKVVVKGCSGNAIPTSAYIGIS